MISSEGAQAETRERRRRGITTQILVGLILGIVIGFVWPSFGVALRPLADLFLRLIKMIIAPLLFSTLVVGIGGAGDLKALGRMGVKALVYFELATTVALLLGLALVNIFAPGSGLAVPLVGDTASVTAMAASAQRGWDLLLHLVPTSVIDAMARGDLLQVVVFATLFGVALSAIGPRGKPVLDVLDSTAAVMFKLTGYVMMAAPVGVGAALAATIGSNGPMLLLALAKLVVLMYVGLALFVLLVIGAASRIVKVPFLAFLAAIREPFLIAFSTASSEAALPKALEVMERFGVPKNIVAFVLPTGYSFNLDGTTLYLSLASVFVAQLAGVPLTATQQVLMMLALMLASKGVAGVPRGALVVLTAMLTQFGLPLEGAAVLLGIDQVMDMGRTAVNVMGNCIATVVVARWEGVFDDEQMRAYDPAGRYKAA